MSINGEGRERLEVLENELRERFPGPEHTYELLIHLAARTELYHCAVDAAVFKVEEMNQKLERRPCVLREAREECTEPES